MHLKKIIAIFLAAALMLSALAIPVSAEDTEIFKVEVEAQTTTSTLSSLPIIYNPGDEITVTISASQNTGISSLMLYIDYDEKALEVITEKTVSKNLFTEADQLTSTVTAEGDGYLVLYSDNYPNVSTAKGVMAEITFLVKEVCAKDAAVTVRLFQNSKWNCVVKSASGVSAVPFASESNTFSIHNIDKATGVVTAPTCTEQGYTTYTCGTCKETVVGNTVAALGHAPAAAVEENRVESNCTEKGTYDSVVYCSVCKVELERTSQAIDAKGHTPDSAVEENRVEPTCTEKGKYDSVVYCKICKTELARTSVEIVEKGHSAATPVEEDRKEATCTEAGSYNSVVYCATCKVKLSSEAKTIPALGHDLAHTDAKDPTCTEIGWNAYDACRREGCGYTTYVELPIIPHTYGEWKADEDGKTHTQVCACGDKKTEEHTFGEWEVVTPATTAAAGLEKRTCSACGAFEEQEIAKLLKNGWVNEGGKWYYYNDDVKVVSKWMKDSIGWVYLGSDGAMVTNKWVKDSIGWCYVGANGYAVTNCWKEDSVGWCYLNASGSMTKNAWVEDGGKLYYVDANGYKVINGWARDSKGWVYLGADGTKVTNKWVKDSIGWCYVGEDGYAVTNCWKKDSVGWCYLNASGSMTKNAWVKENGKSYYLDANGYMVANKTITISGKQYTFNASGVCVS